MPREDAEILRECQRGSTQAFRELVERYQQRAFWTARNIVNDSTLAEDKLTAAEH
jgi:DNA-directed RNA polymerase specialized sigma24 family protein